MYLQFCTTLGTNHLFIGCCHLKPPIQTRPELSCSRIQSVAVVSCPGDLSIISASLQGPPSWSIASSTTQLFLTQLMSQGMQEKKGSPRPGNSSHPQWKFPLQPPGCDHRGDPQNQTTTPSCWMNLLWTNRRCIQGRSSGYHVSPSTHSWDLVPLTGVWQRYNCRVQERNNLWHSMS